MKPKLAYNLIHNVDFDDNKKRASFISNMDGFEKLLRLARSRTTEIKSMCEMPVLKKREEQHLFRQYNAIKYQGNLSLTKPKTYAKIATHLQEVKDVVVMCNIRLVVNFVRKRGYDAQLFPCKFSDAYNDMVHAVDLFDYARGFKFSTYCSWVLIKNFSRGKILHDRQKLIRYMDPTIFTHSSLDPEAPQEDETPYATNEQQASMAKLFRAANLTRREIQCIVENLGISGEKQTLENIGRSLKISKERVRQIKEKAIRKMRNVLEDNYRLLEVS